MSKMSSFRPVIGHTNLELSLVAQSLSIEDQIQSGDWIFQKVKVDQQITLG